MDYAKLASELLKSLRGRRSQTAFSTCNAGGALTTELIADELAST